MTGPRGGPLGMDPQAGGRARARPSRVRALANQAGWRRDRARRGPARDRAGHDALAATARLRAYDGTVSDSAVAGTMRGLARPQRRGDPAWDGPLYERFVRFREIVTTGLGAHGEEALRLHPPAPGRACARRRLRLRRHNTADRAAWSRRTARRSASMRLRASSRTRSARRARRAWRTALPGRRRAGVAAGEGAFDVAFSRFGTMFFANPVAAMRNVRLALVPGGELVMVVWRGAIDNDWLYRAQTIVEGDRRAA